MQTRNIIVIGASAGGFDALKTLVAGLPADLPATLLIVWHMAPDTTGVLPQVFNKCGSLPASNACDGEALKPGHIYVAPPDRHLLLEDGVLRTTHGPKENRFRPAIDPLFRSAAYAYGPRVIGVILSGALDDGTSGLWTIKEAGGLAVVQHPADADVPSMPENALRAVAVDYCVPVAEMAPLLTRLCREEIPQNTFAMKPNGRTQKEIAVAAEDTDAALALFKTGDLTPFTCPECGGVLARFREATRFRFRCHTGHAFSSDALLTAVTEQVEDGFYRTLRSMDEGVMLLNHMGDHLAEANEPRLAALYFKKAKEFSSRADVLREAAGTPGPLSAETLREEAGPGSAPEE